MCELELLETVELEIGRLVVFLEDKEAKYGKVVVV